MINFLTKPGVVQLGPPDRLKTARFIRRLCCCLVPILLSSLVSVEVPLRAAIIPSQDRGQVLLNVMLRELDRAKLNLFKLDPAPYFISYAVRDQNSVIIIASDGALMSSVRTHRQMGDVSLHVGSPALDNTHDGERSSGLTSGMLSLGDDPNAISRQLWLLTDREYKKAVEAYLRVKTKTAVYAPDEDESPDFSQAAPTQHTEVAGQPVYLDQANWEEKARKYSSYFRRYPEVYRSIVMAQLENTERYFVSTDGSKVESTEPVARLFIEALTRSDDGMDLLRVETFQASTPGQLPGEAEVSEKIERMATDLMKLRAAPVADPFSGPALLSGRAAAVFFHEVLGHRLEGQRQRGNLEGQTFTKKIHQQILPSFVSIVDDPTRRELNSVELAGWYKYDDEGVPAAPLHVVENGILKNFLMSRMPIKNFDHSNGHGRASEGFLPVGRQGNLIVTSTHTVADSEIRRKLIDEVKQQGKPYGLYFEDIQGGFTLTTREQPQSFQVLPIMVWKIYPDGRPDQLVRGIDLVGTPLAALNSILLTGETLHVFNGICGAESGNVPVSAVAPAILFSQIEVQRRAQSQERPPLLPPPGAEDAPQAGVR